MTSDYQGIACGGQEQETPSKYWAQILIKTVSKSFSNYVTFFSLEKVIWYMHN